MRQHGAEQRQMPTPPAVEGQALPPCTTPAGRAPGSVRHADPCYAHPGLQSRSKRRRTGGRRKREDGRAPTVDQALKLNGANWLRPGYPTAPEANHLPLLPSGPDGVHGASPRRTRPSTLLGAASSQVHQPRAGIQPRYSGLRVQGTAGSPPSTTAAIVPRPYARQEEPGKAPERLDGGLNPVSQTRNIRAHHR